MGRLVLDMLVELVDRYQTLKQVVRMVDKKITTRVLAMIISIKKDEQMSINQSPTKARAILPRQKTKQNDKFLQEETNRKLSRASVVELLEKLHKLGIAELNDGLEE